MKSLNIIQLEKIHGGDEIDDLVGSLSCGFAVGTLLFGGLGILATVGCINWIRNNI